MTVSVFITSYNQRAFLIEAIQSVLAQSLHPSQIIIVDDCSADGSQEVIGGFVSRYPNLITAIYHTQNQGIAQTRIDALRAVTGDYVTYVDGDDRFLPAKLEKEARLLQRNPDAQIAFSNNYYMTVDGVHTGVWAGSETPPQGNVFRQTFARDFPKRSLFRMELVEYNAWKKIGFHDPTLHLYEDFDMRIRLTKRYRTVYCDEPLSEIRIHNTGLSKAKAAQHLAALEYIYRKNMPLLDDLSVAERRDAQRKLGDWMAAIARRAARETLDNGRGPLSNRQRAIRYYLKSLKYQPCYLDYRLMARILMPWCVRQRLKSGLSRIRR